MGTPIQWHQIYWQHFCTLDNTIGLSNFVGKVSFELRKFKYTQIPCVVINFLHNGVGYVKRLHLEKWRQLFKNWDIHKCMYTFLLKCTSSSHVYYSTWNLNISSLTKESQGYFIIIFNFWERLSLFEKFKRSFEGFSFVLFDSKTEKVLIDIQNRSFVQIFILWNFTNFLDRIGVAFIMLLTKNKIGFSYQP